MNILGLFGPNWKTTVSTAAAATRCTVCRSTNYYGLLESSSPGRYFNAYLKGRY